MSINRIIDPLPKEVLGSGNPGDYELIERIGSGRYGEVFKAFNVTNNKTVAIKVLKPIRSEKVIREVTVLKCLIGGHNIIPLKDIILNNGIPSLVFPFISDQTLRSLSSDLNEYEIHFYLFKLLKAIDFAHKKNIIHRDIKPSNVVIDRQRKVLRLIDWGLADFYCHNKLFSVSVASRPYKSPELLCSNNKYDYSLDIWSFGCIVAALVFKRDPFFQGLDNGDQLKTICSVLGTQCLRDYIKKYNLNKNLIKKDVYNSDIKPRNWNDFRILNPRFESLGNDMAVDFIDKLLVFDHKFRLTSDEALSHPFFNGIKATKVVPLSSQKIN